MSKPKRDNVYFYSAPALAGPDQPEKIDMNDFKNKVLIIVNVASEWGVTKQNYEQLNQLYEKYNSQGLEIIAQPCNQFGKQEPKSGIDLYNHLFGNFSTNKFLSNDAKPKFIKNYFDRKDVNGSVPEASELFLYLQKHKNCPGLLGFNSIKWNFTKFLIGKDGVPIKRLGPKDGPIKLEDDIVKALAQ